MTPAQLNLSILYSFSDLPSVIYVITTKNVFECASPLERFSREIKGQVVYSRAIAALIVCTVGNAVAVLARQFPSLPIPNTALEKTITISSVWYPLYTLYTQ